SLEPLIMGVLAPIGPRAGELTERIMQSIDNVNESMLASISVAVLIVSALSMAHKVETSFNFVWRVGQPRSWWRRFTEYLGIIVIGPALMSHAMMQRVAQLGPFGHWLAASSGLAPYLLVTATFILLYVYVPNTRVRL